MCDKQKVYVYCLPQDESRSTDEKLQQIAQRHSVRLNLSLKGDPRCLFRVERTAKGKPFFPECPQLHFSVSHSGAYFVCALSDAPVGVDLQEHTRLKRETMENTCQRHRKIAKRFFHPVESRWIEWEPYTRFFSVWSARESYVKYTGSGIDAAFQEICVLPNQEILSLSLEAEVTWQNGEVWFRQIQFPSDYTLCICSPMPNVWEIICEE